MIGHIRGILLDKTTHEVLVEAGGIGYEVSLTMPAWFALGESNQEVSIWCHMVVREDAQQLYGFSNKDERLMFRELIRISGIGPKVAQAILSGMDITDLINAIRNNEVAALVKMPGIGKKTAERLIIELQDRLQQLDFAENQIDLASPSLSSESAGNRQLEEAEQALMALGYKSSDTKRMLKSLPVDCQSVEDMVRFALRSGTR